MMNQDKYGMETGGKMKNLAIGSHLVEWRLHLVTLELGDLIPTKSINQSP